MKRKLMLVALIALVLCTGLGFKLQASCTAPPMEWRLTIGTTEGGEVVTPGEGRFFYQDGEVVTLVAVPAHGYRFVKWTGKVDTIENHFMADTTITMALDYTITANFAPVDEGAPMGYS